MKLCTCFLIFQRVQFTNHDGHLRHVSYLDIILSWSYFCTNKLRFKHIRNLFVFWQEKSWMFVNVSYVLLSIEIMLKPLHWKKFNTFIVHSWTPWLNDKSIYESYVLLHLCVCSSNDLELRTCKCIECF